MPNDVRTNVVIEGKAKGFDKVTSVFKDFDKGVMGLLKMKKSTDANEMSAKKYRVEVEKLSKNIREMAKDQLRLIEAMKGLDKSSQGYKSLATRLKEVGEAQKLVEKQTHLTTQAFQKQAQEAAKEESAAKQRRGSFTQGMLQGVLPQAAFLQRGPGMFRQAMGVATGAAGKQIVGGLGSSPFTGMQGIAGALAANPLTALAGGQIQAALGMGEGSLASKRLRMELAPFLGSNLMNEQAAGGRAAGRIRRPELLSQKEIDRQVAEERSRAVGAAGVSTPEIESRAREYRNRAILNRAQEAAGGSEEFRKLGLKGQAPFLKKAQEASAQFEENYRRQAFTDIAKQTASEVGTKAADAARERLEAPEKAFRAQQASARAKAIAEERARFNAPINAGAAFGYGRNEMMQMGGTMGQVAGGRALEERGGRQMLPLAAAAQRAFGLDAGTAGSFLLGQRRGGIVGAGGAGAEGYAKSIGDAVALGLSGSELTDYMQQMAEGINSWKMTGISIDPASIGQMGQEVARTGIGGLQGARIAQGLAGAGRQIAQGGPQSAEQMAIFQDLYGFQGGGLGEYKEALQKAQEGTMAEGGFEKLMSRAQRAAGGDKSGGTLVALDMLQKAGIQMSIRDLDLMMKQSRIRSGAKEELTDVEARRISQVEDEMRVAAGGKPLTAASIEAQAKAMTPADIERQTRLENKRLDVGEKMIPSMQNLETQATSMASAFATGLGPAVKTLTGHVADVSKGFENFANKMRKQGFLEASASSLGIGP